MAPRTRTTRDNPSGDREPPAAPEAGHYFIRFVPQDVVEATVNLAYRLGYRHLDWDRMTDGDEAFREAVWMVYGRMPAPDACPLCDAGPDDPDDDEDG